MADVKFHDYTIDVKKVLAEVAESALEEAAGELEARVKRNTAVDTGQLKNSWTHLVTQDGQDYVAVIGSPLQNAIWEEFGTGEYALNGNGRKGGWVYVDEHDKGHFTYGKKPKRAFHNAYTALKTKLIKYIQDKFKGGLS